jgi:hypothetical protein
MTSEFKLPTKPTLETRLTKEPAGDDSRIGPGRSVCSTSTIWVFAVLELALTVLACHALCERVAGHASFSRIRSANFFNEINRQHAP